MDTDFIVDIKKGLVREFAGLSEIFKGKDGKINYTGKHKKIAPEFSLSEVLASFKQGKK